MMVSSVLLLFWDQYILSMPPIVTQSNALLEEWGWLGPLACKKQLS